MLNTNTSELLCCVTLSHWQIEITRNRGLRKQSTITPPKHKKQRDIWHHCGRSGFEKVSETHQIITVGTSNNYPKLSGIDSTFLALVRRLYFSSPWFCPPTGAPDLVNEGWGWVAGQGDRSGVSNYSPSTTTSTPGLLKLFPSSYPSNCSWFLRDKQRSTQQWRDIYFVQDRFYVQPEKYLDHTWWHTPPNDCNTSHHTF